MKENQHQPGQGAEQRFSVFPLVPCLQIEDFRRHSAAESDFFFYFSGTSVTFSYLLR